MRKNKNTINIEGKIYQFDLEQRETGESSKHPGTPYIRGTIDVATDDELTNIVTVNYTYVAPTYSSGKPNRTFTVLQQIIDSAKTVQADGADAATYVRLTPSYAMNDFYNQQDELVSTPRNEGGFANIVNDPASLHKNGDVWRSRFENDVVIFNAEEVEVDEGDNFVRLNAITFDFRKVAIPMTLTVRQKDACKYFLDLAPTKKNPVYTCVWGKIVSTFVEEKRERESAFGPAEVTTVKHKTKEYLVTGANSNPYEFDDEATITAAELNKSLQDRETLLADIKKRNEEYKASQSTQSAGNFPFTPAKSEVKEGGFNF